MTPEWRRCNLHTVSLLEGSGPDPALGVTSLVPAALPSTPRRPYPPLHLLSAERYGFPSNRSSSGTRSPAGQVKDIGIAPSRFPPTTTSEIPVIAFIPTIVICTMLEVDMEMGGMRGRS